ncbi:MAG: M23 family metallopeptidase [Deltaproteobacteria bacterium]|nr:M23 family metallopeptidase [Deltaproteobacteria bacterium]
MRKCIPAILVSVALVAAGAHETRAAGHRRVKRHAAIGKLAETLGMGTRLAATLLLNGGFPDDWLAAAGGTQTPDHLAWPVPGHRLGRGFGSNNGEHLAVDVTAPRGTPVLCMAHGIVGYAGNEINGYGNTVLVLHPGGWVTLYAHLDTFRVEAGEKVSERQVLGAVGKTGITRGFHLHFSLHVRGKAVDPMRYMLSAPERNAALSMLLVHRSS